MPGLRRETAPIPCPEFRTPGLKGSRQPPLSAALTMFVCPEARSATVAPERAANHGTFITGPWYTLSSQPRRPPGCGATAETRREAAMTPQERKRIFRTLGIRPRPKGAGCGGEWFAAGGGRLEVRSPTTGELLAEVDQAAEADYARIMDQAVCAFGIWARYAGPAARRNRPPGGYRPTRKRRRLDAWFRWRWARF